MECGVGKGHGAIAHLCPFMYNFLKFSGALRRFAEEEFAMADRYLVVVDMQKDFVDGALGTPEALAMLPALEEKLKVFDGVVLATMDTHGSDYLETSEGRKLPVTHCVEGTPGWALDARIAPLLEEKHAELFRKPTFGSVALAEELARRAKQGLVASVEFVGLCTDICVVSNALLVKAFLPELPLRVDSRCCAGVTPESHEAALKTMESCQIEVQW